MAGTNSAAGARSLKERLKERLKAMKKEVKGKVAGSLKGSASKIVALALLPFALLLLGYGCMGTTPSARSNTSSYEKMFSVKAGDKAVVTLNVTLGDGLLASADGGGDTQTATPTQTTDVTPSAAVAWGASNASVGSSGTATAQQGLLEKGLEKLRAILTGKTGVALDADEAKAVRDCVDGNCCEGGSCSEN